MTRIAVKSRVGPDGTLSVTVPLSPDDGNREVIVSVEPAETTPTAITPEAWRKLIEQTAGSIEDPTFIRHNQGKYEERETWG